MDPPPPRVASNTDGAVIETNNEAAGCKWSCVQKGYYKDEFIQHLVLALGAGSDTAFFVLAAEAVPLRRYLEVDFVDVTSRKAAAVLAKPALRDLVGVVDDPAAAARGVLLAGRYALVPADLRDADSLEAAMRAGGLDLSAPTLVIAECVLVYLPPAASAALLARTAALLPCAAVAIYEPIGAEDAFGLQMAANLEARGCPLLGLRATPSLDAQCARLAATGWGAPGVGRAEAVDMEWVYGGVIDQEDARRVDRIEPLDEIEEWRLIMQHYCLALGVRDAAGTGVLSGLTLLEDATGGGPTRTAQDLPAAQRRV